MSARSYSDVAVSTNGSTRKTHESQHRSSAEDDMKAKLIDMHGLIPGTFISGKVYDVSEHVDNPDYFFLVSDRGGLPTPLRKARFVLVDDAPITQRSGSYSPTDATPDVANAQFAFFAKRLDPNECVCGTTRS